MARNNIAKPRSKPAKPYAEFPLFPHATKRWAKKIRGKFHFFGPWDDPDTALQKYLDQKDDLHAGRVPRAKLNDGLTLRELLNHFLTAKQRKVDAGELGAASIRCDTLSAPSLTRWATSLPSAVRFHSGLKVGKQTEQTRNRHISCIAL